MSINNVLVFTENQKQLYLEEFIRILKLIIFSYHQMISQENNLAGQKEDDLRNKLVKNYLRKNKNKDEFNLGKMFFNLGTEEVNDHKSSKTTGRLDFTALRLVDSLGRANEDFYFTFECKRLKNNGKNNEYIKEGMQRFIAGKYQTKILPLAGMIAFVEKGCINKIVANINNRLKKDYSYSDSEFLYNETIENNFKYSYLSNHSKNDNSKIKIYHLMLDLSWQCLFLEQLKR